MIYLFVLSPIIIASLFFIKPKHVVFSTLLAFVKVIFILAFTLLLCRVYWFDIYKIPSESMEQTLMIGDKIIIRKGKLPINNEVVVFEMRDWKKPLTLVKRCVAVPGDTLASRQDSVFINHQFLSEKETMKWGYYYNTECLSIMEVENELGRKITRWKEKEQLLMALTKQESLILVSRFPQAQLHQATLTCLDKGNIFPWKRYLENNRSNIHPVYVPEKGHTVNLSKQCAAWYFKIIKSENENVKIAKGVVSIDGQIIEEYTFKHNYYYMMGDNRNRSQDSRYWGFVREEYIMGKVLCKLNFKSFNIKIVQ